MSEQEKGTGHEPNDNSRRHRRPPVGRRRNAHDQFATSLPAEVRPNWNLDEAFRETTPTRERICINGLWRWQPGLAASRQVPAGNWGYFKVPGCWPGITDYMQKDCQTVFAHSSWKNVRLGSVSAAWYEREIAIPPHWAGRRIALAIECLNSLAAVYVDGRKSGEIRFPGGDLDLTPVFRAGGKHVLSMLVVALPLKRSWSRTAILLPLDSTRGTVPRRGLCGDVYLVGTPARAAHCQCEGRHLGAAGPNFVRCGITGTCCGRALCPARSDHERRPHRGRAQKVRDSRERNSRMAVSGLAQTGSRTGSGISIGHKTRIELGLSLLDADGEVLDTAFDLRFGFREFWIDGRDFYPERQSHFSVRRPA